MSALYPPAGPKLRYVPVARDAMIVSYYLALRRHERTLRNWSAYFLAVAAGFLYSLLRGLGF